MPPPPAPPVVRADNAQFLRKQRAAVEVIAADNMKLKEELMLENKFSVNPTTQTAAALIANLQEQADVYAAKITEEQRLKAELEHQVEVLKQRIADQRVQMGGINNAAEQSVKAQRKIKILEDRLQQASVRYNEMLTRNRQLRDRIDSLRRERMLFEELRAKLQKGLERRKEEMIDVIARIAESHDAREKAIILQGQVKTQADKDVANYEAEWRQLTDIVEQDRRSREGQRQRDIAAREQQMAELFKQQFTVPPKRRPTMRPATGAAAGADSKPADAAALAPERVRQLKEAFSKVLAATGAADVDDLLELLVAGEEANFSLFNYVNNLSGEVDKLEESIGTLRAEVERYRSETLAAANDDRTRQLRALDAELAEVEEQAAEYEDKHSQAVGMVNSLRAAVMDMFNRTGCAQPAVLELLGGEGVTEKNMMQYLGVLEQRANELLTQYFVLASDGSDDVAVERATAVLTGKHSAQAPLQFVIEPPSATGAAAAAAGGAAAMAAAGLVPRSGGSGSRGGTGGGGRAGDEEGTAAADDERPLSRGSLVARAHKSVASRVETAVKIKAVRAVQGVSSTGSRR